LPKQEPEFALTPKLWLALGIVTMIHRLVGQGPAQIDGNRKATSITNAEAQQLEKGMAAAVDTKGMRNRAGAAQYALAAVARVMLNPLGIEVTMRTTGEDAERPYMLITDQGEPGTFLLREDTTKEKAA
jgi:hypothetical protein